MKKLLSILALSLLLAVPAVAQQPDPYEPDPLENQENQQQVTDEEQYLDESEQVVEPGEGEELPRTASPIALLALIGLGGAGTAAGLRLRRK